MVTYTLDNFRLPGYLYRVQYEGSWTTYTPSRDLQAAAQYTSWQGEEDFHGSMRSHYDWRSGVPSPFISTFWDAEHAARWGRCLAQARSAIVLTISTRELYQSNLVFRGYGPHELLFLRGVPARAIIAETSLVQFGLCVCSFYQKFSLRKLQRRRLVCTCMHTIAYSSDMMKPL